jgi:CheY-like chemotaxis protein
MSAAAQPTPPKPLQPTLAGRTVLVVEDHRDSRELLTALLRSLQAHVVDAPNIEQPEREIEFARPHLIICDMKLPDGTGLDFVRWVRTHRRAAKTPCVAITGWENQFPASVAHGFDAYMRKPINIDKFCTVAVALAQR